MRYVYDTYKIINGEAIRIDTCTRIEEAEKNARALEFQQIKWYITIFDGVSNKMTQTKLKSMDDIEEWYDTLARSVWNDKKIVDNNELLQNYISEYIAFNPKGTVVISSKTSGDTPEAIQKFVEPRHYKRYVEDRQWLDEMALIPSFKDPAVFQGAIELQVRKYLDRNNKDTKVQELKKAKFYLQYLIAYLENGGKPVLIKDIPHIYD